MNTKYPGAGLIASCGISINGHIQETHIPCPYCKNFIPEDTLFQTEFWGRCPSCPKGSREVIMKGKIAYSSLLGQDLTDQDETSSGQINKGSF